MSVCLDGEGTGDATGGTRPWVRVSAHVCRDWVSVTRKGGCIDEKRGLLPAVLRRD